MAVSTASFSRADVYAANPEKKVALYFVVTGLAALFVGTLIGILQAFNYAGINLYDNFPFLASYYQGLTLHGVLNVIVFTTFFICGMMFYLPVREMNARPNMTWIWSAYWVMFGGLFLAGVAIITNNATVLYTFYPPLQGSWGFYTGAALIIVGSIMVGIEVVRLRQRWKRDHPDEATPIVTFMSTATWLMWILATFGIVTEVVVFLIPWSLGLREGVDPQLARTLFWFTGHPIVYFWLLPAYISWYALVPKMAGGTLASEALARLAFLMFLLFSVPVGMHHQFTDPGISAGWKMVHSLLTMFVGIPSLLTAFTVASSLELAGKSRGGRGVFGWIPKLPWGNAAFAAQILAMISFMFGGAGGIILASFNLNVMLHNTAWIPGHFHITVGTATTLTFMGISFWLLPHFTRKPLASNGLALASAWLWFVGMMTFALGMHWQGLLGVPRRAQISNLAPSLDGAYASAALPQLITGVSGIILALAVVCYFGVIFATLFKRDRVTEDEAPAIPFVDRVKFHKDSTIMFLDRIYFWFGIAIAIVIVAYAPTLVEMFLNQVPVPGMRMGW
ncbi:MAG: b(o/a)3-type cytochrome-c oxidase subunit 1 [Trueperaceae bacterium]|nr:b(o/a)3-type cytochrome-c oxidase subunit 1 [Trueperaceae bacterium]